MRPLDPVEQIGALGDRPLLFGRRDFYIPLMTGLELRRAAGGEAVELKLSAGALGLAREGK